MADTSCRAMAVAAWVRNKGSRVVCLTCMMLLIARWRSFSSMHTDR